MQGTCRSTSRRNTDIITIQCKHVGHTTLLPARPIRISCGCKMQDAAYQAACTASCARPIMCRGIPSNIELAASVACAGLCSSWCVAKSEHVYCTTRCTALPASGVLCFCCLIASCTAPIDHALFYSSPCTTKV